MNTSTSSATAVVSVSDTVSLCLLSADVHDDMLEANNGNDISGRSMRFMTLGIDDKPSSVCDVTKHHKCALNSSNLAVADYQSEEP